MTGADAVARRISNIAESATMAITAQAREMRARGRSVIGFGAGEPDFPTPAPIVEAAAEAARNPAMHKYTPAAGLPELREAVAEKTGRHSGLEVSPSQVLITNGGKQAVYTAVQCLVDEGDEALLPAPYWVTYPEAVSLAGGRAVAVPTDAASGFKVSVEQLEEARTPRTKLLIFVSPSNPTGAVYTPQEVTEIGQWAAANGVWTMTDEIYEHLVYGGARFSSLPVQAPEAASRCVVVSGVAKTFAMTGWRVGWMIGPPEVMTGAIRLQGHLTSNVCNVAQAAALAAVAGPMDEVESMREAFDRRRRTMHGMLEAMEGVTCREPEGAFYCFPSLEGALGRPLGPGGSWTADTALELAALCLEQTGTAFVPGEAFGAPGYSRFSYALGDEDLRTGLTRLGEFLSG